MPEENPQSSPILFEESPSPTSPSPEEPSGKPGESFIGEIIRFTIIALLIVLPIRIFIAQPYVVSGASMDPTFADHEYIIVDQVSRRFKNPERGQVIIFKYPKDETKHFIKRIIGLPGETVDIDNGKVTIKNEDYPLGFELDEPYISTSNMKNDQMSVTLGKDEYFVMGDNRRQSSDSRAWGSLPRSNIVGTPFIRLFPLDRVEIAPGLYKEAR